MLVLARYPKESVMIGDEIEVQVLGVVGNKVKLGITAPLNVNIVRPEVSQDNANPPHDPDATPVSPHPTPEAGTTANHSHIDQYA